MSTRPDAHPRAAGASQDLGPTQPPDRFDPRLLPALVLGAVLNPVNSSIIAVSLVPIGRAFDLPASRTVWLVSGLYVATALGQPVVGRLVDLFGPRRLFLAATVLAGAAGLLGALAPSFEVLVAARVLLGFGTCAGYPAAMTLIRSEADRTGQDSPAGVLTVLAVSSQTVAVVGPTLGGLLVAAGGWRATFAINVPLAAVALVTGWISLPRTRPTSMRGAGARNRLDLPGIGLFAVMLVSLMVVLLDLRWTAAPVLVVTAAAGWLFVRRETRVPEPFLDVRVLAGNGPLVRTYARMFLGMTVAYTFLYGYTQWLEDGRGLSASHAGLLLLPLSATALVVSALTGRRPEVRGKLLTAAVLQAAAGALLLTLGSHSAVWLLVGVAAVAGVPQGLNSLANQNAVYHQAEAASLGASSGLLRTATYLGAMAASAAAAACFGPRADTGGLHGLGVVVVVAALLFLALTLLDRPLADVGRTHPTPGGEDR